MADLTRGLHLISVFVGIIIGLVLCLAATSLWLAGNSASPLLPTTTRSLHALCSLQVSSVSSSGVTPALSQADSPVSVPTQLPQQTPTPLNTAASVQGLPQQTPTPLTTPGSVQGPEAYCKALQSNYNIVPGKSWGTLPGRLQGEYKKRQCDQYLVKVVEPVIQLQTLPSPVIQPPFLSQSPTVVEQCKGEELGPERARCELATLNTAWYTSLATMQKFCEAVRDSDRQMWPDWESAHCDCLFEQSWNAEKCTSLASPFRHATASAEGIRQAAKSWVESNPPVRVNANKPVVALLISVVASKRETWASVADVPLFRIALEDILETLEEPFEYWFFVGFDEGDKYFDREEATTGMRETFAERVSGPAKQKGVDAVLCMLKFSNPMKKPGPMFNFLSAAAMLAGADFMYRINDDTKVATKFAGNLVDCLARMDPPFLGCCGPTHSGGTAHILTHDFVHRTHLMIFPTHYPAVFSDWFLDDWISIVYTPSNTVRVGTVVVHHETTKTRYSVNHKNRKFLFKEVKLGAAFVEAFRAVYSSVYRYNPLSRIRPLRLASGVEYNVTLLRRKDYTLYKAGLFQMPRNANDTAWLQHFQQEVALRREQNRKALRRRRLRRR